MKEGAGYCPDGPAFPTLPLLAAGIALTGWAVVTAPGRATLLGVGFALFAGLEHLNYFHIQLMHDTRNDLRRLWSGGLRRSHLARDLDQSGISSTAPPSRTGTSAG